MSEEARRRALDYLRTHQVMTLATHGSEGLWAAAVFYTNDDFDLIFLSAAHTRHARNLAANPWTAATIQEDYNDWTVIQGIQLEGRVRVLEGATRQAAIDLYRAKYRFLDDAPPSIQTALARVSWYRIVPERLYFVDNSQGFGHRDEVKM